MEQGTKETWSGRLLFVDKRQEEQKVEKKKKKRANPLASPVGGALSMRGTPCTAAATSPS
jgi:hypothetical protein